MGRLRVYYGWARINKIRKREAISVIFENSQQTEERAQWFIKRMQDTVYTRFQTDGEASDGEYINRMYTEYSIFLDHKNIKGSLEAALLENYRADSKNVSKKVLEEIRDKLRISFMNTHPRYKEPNNQLEFNFAE